MSPWATAATVSAAPSDDYAAFCDGLQRLCGLDLSEHDREARERRVRSLARRRGMPALPEYLALLSADQRELAQLVDRLGAPIARAQRPANRSLP